MTWVSLHFPLILSDRPSTAIPIDRSIACWNQDNYYSSSPQLPCNGELVLVDKAAIHNRVPYYTRLYYDKFTQCPNCHQIYWQGAHYERLQALIDLAKAQAVTPAIEKTKQ